MKWKVTVGSVRGGSCQLDEGVLSGGVLEEPRGGESGGSPCDMMRYRSRAGPKNVRVVLYWWLVGRENDEKRSERGGRKRGARRSELPLGRIPAP